MSTHEQDTAPGLERVEAGDFQRSNAPDIHREVMDMIGEDPDTVQRPGFAREVQDVIKNTEQVIAPAQRTLAEEIQAYCAAVPEVADTMRATASDDDAVAGLAVADVVFDNMERGGVTRYQRKQNDDDNPLAALLDALPDGYENDPEPRKLREAQVVIKGADGEVLTATLEDDEDNEDDLDDDDDLDDEGPATLQAEDNHLISACASIVDERETQAQRKGEGVMGYDNDSFSWDAAIPSAPDLQKQYPELDAQVQMPEDDVETMQTAQGTTVVQDRDNSVSVAQLQKSLQGIATLAAHAFSSTPGCNTLEQSLDSLDLHEGHTRTRNGIMSGYAAGFEDGYRTAIRRLAELDPTTDKPSTNT